MRRIDTLNERVDGRTARYHNGQGRLRTKLSSPPTAGVCRGGQPSSEAGAGKQAGRDERTRLMADLAWTGLAD